MEGLAAEVLSGVPLDGAGGPQPLAEDNSERADIPDAGGSPPIPLRPRPPLSLFPRYGGS